MPSFTRHQFPFNSSDIICGWRKLHTNAAEILAHPREFTSSPASCFAVPGCCWQCYGLGFCCKAAAIPLLLPTAISIAGCFTPPGSTADSEVTHPVIGKHGATRPVTRQAGHSPCMHGIMNVQKALWREQIQSTCFSTPLFGRLG